MESRYLTTIDAADDELEQLVIRITARGSGQTLPKPPAEAIVSFLARTANEEPMSSEELEEHERLWRAVDEERHVIERADEITNGQM